MILDRGSVWRTPPYFCLTQPRERMECHEKALPVRKTICRMEFKLKVVVFDVCSNVFCAGLVSYCMLFLH
jgi:hypothetical protein